MSVGAVNKQTGDRIPTAGMPAIDSVLSGSSTNPVQNRVVKAALDEKADTELVASDFDATASYTAGNYCIYEGKFYRFKNNHSGAWAAADVDEIQIAGELSSIKSDLTNLLTVLTVVSNDSGVVTDINFPDGYHASDCIVLAVAIIADPSNNMRMWGEYIDKNNATGHYVYVDTNGLVLVVRDTDDWGKTFNIILTKKSLFN